MAKNLVSAAVSGFHIGECTDVEQAHFWSESSLVNGIRSWQLIIKHDLTHRFHGWTLGVCPVAFDLKHDMMHRFHGRTLGVRPSVRVSHWWGHRCGTGGRIHLRKVSEVAIDYKTWFDTSVLWPDTWCPPQWPGFTSVRASMWNRPTSGARVHLWMLSEVGNLL